MYILTVWLNQMVKNKNTEQTILNAARDVFLSKGFDGTRMQEIADEAGINKALLHYYFRNKDKLFGAVLNSIMQQIGPVMFEFVKADIPLEIKITKFVEGYIEMIKKIPKLPLFILNEINVNPERILKHLNFRKFIDIKSFSEQIKKETDTDTIIDIDSRQLIVSILGMVIFPFAGKPIFQKNLKINDKEWELFIEERKDILPKIIMDGIRKKQTDQ